MKEQQKLEVPIKQMQNDVTRVSAQNTHILLSYK